MIADIIRGIHMLMFVAVLVGPFLTPRRYLPYYMLFVLIIFLDWNDIDGVCILTKLENYFRYGSWDSRSPTEGGPEFFRPLFEKITGISLTRPAADRLNNFIFLVCWLVAFLRYARF